MIAICASAAAGSRLTPVTARAASTTRGVGRAGRADEVVNVAVVNADHRVGWCCANLSKGTGCAFEELVDRNGLNGLELNKQEAPVDNKNPGIDAAVISDENAAVVLCASPAVLSEIVTAIDQAGTRS